MMDDVGFFSLYVFSLYKIPIGSSIVFASFAYTHFFLSFLYTISLYKSLYNTPYTNTSPLSRQHTFSLDIFAPVTTIALFSAIATHHLPHPLRYSRPTTPSFILLACRHRRNLFRYAFIVRFDYIKLRKHPAVQFRIPEDFHIRRRTHP